MIDANDMPPIFSLNEYYASVKEDVNIGTAVALATAADGDLTSNAKVLKNANGNLCIFITKIMKRFDLINQKLIREVFFFPNQIFNK